MNKSEIISSLTAHHTSFINYINGLSDDEYTVSPNQKWTAGQHVQHIILCVKPLVQVFSMDKFAIEQTFGVAHKPSRIFDDMCNAYSEKLKEGIKAPDRFVPAAVSPDQRKLQGETLTKVVQALCEKIEGFTEPELDRMCIPHPVLGKLTMREMLYNAVDHVRHHHKMVQSFVLK
ncbi:MAG TPA: DinB family protein [Bacteroidia bacterium]|nr:DinB family protein [Bacteroidia bacterium]